MSGVWQAASSLRNTICSHAADHKVPGVRLNATKFLEQIVLLFTADTVPALMPGAKGMRQQTMQGLHGLLTPAAVSHSPKHVSTVNQPNIVLNSVAIQAAYDMLE